MADLLELAKLNIETSGEFTVSAKGVNVKDIELEITDFGGIPEDYRTPHKLFAFAQAFAECSHDIDVVEAAMDCEVNPGDIDDVYEGQFKDDEDFAYNMAEQTGAINKDAAWPYDCIDWERAARDLMMDYSSHNGYYFRTI